MKKFYLLLIGTFSFFSGSFAQSAIDPVAGGNFDEGNSFVANGWTVVNSSVNQWVVGTGASATPPSSPNTAYISIDGNSANYSYDNTSSHISHFYQVVTLPANAINISLSFQLNGNFENDADGNLVDGLEVYTNDITAIPVADALPSGVNAIQQFFQTSNNTNYIGVTRTLFPGFFAGKTFLVIFSWINNGDNIGDGPPASVDQASLTYCIKGNPYNVTGGGAFCTGSSGVGVGLASSDTAISYQLYNNGNSVGSSINGTGSALDFGPQKVVGNYTIIGTSACNKPYTMAGSVNITENPLPTATAGSNGPLCLGSTLNLNSAGGSSYTWTGPKGFTSTDQNPSIPGFTSDAAGIYTVTVTANGCSAPATTNVVITAGVAIGGTVTSASICDGGNGSLSLSGNSNNPIQWEYTTDSSGASWNTIVNTTTTQSFSGITVPTFYRAVVSDGCGTVYSDTATVSIHNYWTGTISTNWNTAGNWSDGQVPSAASCPDVYIPAGAPNQPVLSGVPTATITNLHIYLGATLTVNNTGLLQVGGTISNTGIFDVTAGSIEFNSTTTIGQNISGSIFSTHTIQNLIVSNANGLNVSPSGDTLKISGTLSFGTTANGKLNTGDNITLLSTAAGTANVGVMSNTNTINGKVTVERFINTGTGLLYQTSTSHAKSWQMLAVPTQGQTIKQSWMEGATGSNITYHTPGSIGNPHSGYGTMMTSDLTTGTTFQNGFDVYTSPGPSIKVYDSSINNYVGPPSTNIPVYNKKGYMILVRGDRSVYTYNAPATPTILRTTGTLFTPAAPPPVSDVLNNQFQSVGNPYASAIDLRNILRGGGVDEFIYVWDPKLAGAYGLGAFQTLSLSGGDYTATPGTGNYSGTTNTIQSGQAFFVEATGTNGTVGFNENAKVNGSILVLRGGSTAGTVGEVAQLRANLYGMADTAFLTDGNLIQYNEAYSNKIDGMDARKLINSSENFGIISGGKNLAVERRQAIEQKDTIFYNLTGVRIQQYKIRFTANGLSAYGQQGFVEDSYLNTRTPLNMEGATEINFAVTNTAGSYASNRFRIVFAPKPPIEVALAFISLTANQQDADIAVAWKVKNEKGMLQYEVETSVDGVNFTKAATLSAINDGAGSYQWIDKKVTAGDHYYRIRCVAGNGRISYSTVVKVTVVYGNPSIRIHPNPITDGIIHLQFVNQPQGRYAIRLMNSLGQIIVSKQIELAGGNATENIQWNYYLSHGVYQLEVTKPDGSVKVIKVLY